MYNFVNPFKSSDCFFAPRDLTLKNSKIHRAYLCVFMDQVKGAAISLYSIRVSFRLFYGVSRTPYVYTKPFHRAVCDTICATEPLYEVS